MHHARRGRAISPTVLRAGRLLLAGTLAATLVVGTVTTPAAADSQDSEKAVGQHDRRDQTEQTRPYDRVLDELLEAEPVGGVLAAHTADGDDITTARGLADNRTERQAKPQDRYRIGSNTKTMTATVVLQLVDEGRLSLDDTVTDLLPRFEDDLDASITVRHLLQHTSGFSRETMLWQEDSAYEQHRFRYFRPEQLVRIALRHPDPRPEPGSQWEYSNTNYVLAGMIVEQVTGNSLRHEVIQRIVQPLRLTDTRFPIVNPALLGRHLRGYYSDGSDTTVYSMSYAWAAGNVVSTASDQTRFLRALLDGELLDEDTLAAMLDTGEFDYGLGIMPIHLPCGGTAYGHDGAVFGYQSANFATSDGRSIAIGVNAWMLDDETGGLSGEVVLGAARALCIGQS